MYKTKRRFVCFLGAACFAVMPLVADTGKIISVPGFGDIGVKREGNAYKVALADWGTWACKGSYDSPTKFDLSANIPAGQFTDYIPAGGQVLSLLGFESIDLRIRPNGIGYGMNCEGGALGALRGSVTDALSKVDALKLVIDKIISAFEINSLTLNGAVFGKTLKGTVTGDISIIGKKLKFKEEGELSLKALVNGIVDEIVPAVSDFAADAVKAVYKESRDAMLSAGKKSIKKLDGAWDDVAKYTREAVKTVKYATHSYDTNLKSDLPKFIKAKTDRLLKESNKSVDALCAELRPFVSKLPPDEKSATIDECFSELIAQLDKKWDSVYKDDAVKSWSTLSKREKELTKRYRSGVSAKWDEQKAYRKRAIEKLKH